MKKFIHKLGGIVGLALLSMFLALPASAQQNYNFNVGGLSFSSGGAVPGSCPIDGEFFWLNTGSKAWYVCVTGTYVQLATGTGGSGTVSANNGSAGAVAVYAAAGGSTTVSASSDLSDPGTGVVTIGAVGAANNGKLTLLGLTSGSQSLSCANATCTQLQTGGPLNVQGVLDFTSALAPSASAHVLISSTSPTIGTCGTSPAVVVANGTGAFELNVGTGGAASTCSFTLPAATTGWFCTAVDVTNPTVGGGFFVKQSSAVNTTSVTLTGYNTAGTATAWTASDILLVTCHGF